MWRLVFSILRRRGVALIHLLLGDLVGDCVLCSAFDFVAGWLRRNLQADQKSL